MILLDYAMKTTILYLSIYLYIYLYIYIIHLSIIYLSKIVLKLLEDGAPFIVDAEGQTALHQVFIFILMTH